jgi:predicted ATPase
VKGRPELEFTPGLNVLVGPNGSGKSTVLRALHACEQCQKEVSGQSNIHYFNSETMNPHARDDPPGDMRNMILKIRGVFSSHGEIMKVALTTLPVREGDSLLIDEPEAGQDMDGWKQIRKGLNAICSKGGQVILASHHPFFLQDANIIELVPGYAKKIRREFCRAPAGSTYEFKRICR